MVEWKTIKDVCDVLNGFAFKSQEYVPAGIRIIRISDVQSGYISDKDKVFYPQERLSEYKRYLLHHGDLVMSLTGNPGRVAFIKDESCALNQRVACLRAKTASNSFLFYLFNCKDFESIAYANSTGGAQKNLSTTWLNNYKIPLPPLSEQTRIVSILDTFTSSITNLKQQIAERRKQYEHYRDQLLDLEGKEGVEMKTLGEIGTFIRGTGIQKNDFVESGYNCIHYGQIHTKYGLSASETISKIEEPLYKKSKKAQKGDVILATTSEDAEGVAKPLVWLGEGEVAVSGDAFIFHHHQNGKFMAYQFVSHRFMLFKIRYATGAKVIRISGENMAKFKVALPHIEVQSRIVSFLDTFEVSISNLEAQLKEREKQYEYYRNQLLSFK
ncbi:MAG: restriction endonuclease subunit S [Bacteroidaceae bacterium]|nr:restriction endonuclease subunit S [Bacteroidaceae bacterium]